jgi:hypothetical protein
MVSERLSSGFNTFMMDVMGDLTIGSPLSKSLAGLSLNLPLEINTPVAALRWTWPPDVETSFFESLSAQASTTQKAVTYHRVDPEVMLVQALTCSAVDYTFRYWGNSSSCIQLSDVLLLPHYARCNS